VDLHRSLLEGRTHIDEEGQLPFGEIDLDLDLISDEAGLESSLEPSLERVVVDVGPVSHGVQLATCRHSDVIDCAAGA
jgi:hypothetical protein